jgi:hypothetical protein
MYQQGRLEEVCRARDEAKVEMLGMSEVRRNKKEGQEPTTASCSYIRGCRKWMMITFMGSESYSAVR